MSMLNVNNLPVSSIRAVFSDLDDTLTENGKISSSTYEALWQLKKAGYWLVIVSGRPAGWADALMRLWPIDHFVFENGAGIMRREGDRVRVDYCANPDGVEDRREQLKTIFLELQKEFPQIKTASDQFCRLFDYTIDHREEPPLLGGDTVKRILDRLSLLSDVTAKLSSIHINYWLGHYTKVTACERLLREATQLITREEIVFVGDSPNDEPLFEYFPNAVGVANVAPYLGAMKFKPKYIASLKGGDGFREVASLLTSSAD